MILPDECKNLLEPYNPSVKENFKSLGLVEYTQAYGRAKGHGH